MGCDATADLLFGFPFPEDFKDIDELREKLSNGESISDFLHEVHTMEDSQLFIALGKTYHSDWDSPLEINELREPDLITYNAARDFCLKIGIEWQQPKWLLVASYW